MLSSKSKKFIKSTLRWKNPSLILGIIFIVSSFTLPAFIMLSSRSPLVPYKQVVLDMINVERLRTEQIIAQTDLEQKLKKQLLEADGLIAKLYSAQDEGIGKSMANFLFLVGAMWICLYMIGKQLEQLVKELQINIKEEIK